MNGNDMGKILLDAVPPLPAPPDRMAEVRRRAATRRRLRRAGTVVAAIAAVAVLGSVLTVLSPAQPASNIGGEPTQSPPQSRSVTVSPGPAIVGPPHTPYSEPPKDFPMPGPGVCPPTVQFMRMPMLDLAPGRSMPPFSAVTLCRYTQSSFDLSQGENSLRTAPVAGNVTAFRDAFNNLTMPRESNWNSEGCREPSPGLPPFTVDVVFVHSPGNTVAVILHRYECANPWPQDPAIPLRTAVDAALGPPYQ
jgi:hypothetical protein